MEWIQGFVVSQVPSPLALPPSSPSSSSSTTTKLLDTFRHLHPDRKEAYTCWSTFLDSRKTNYGTRIDYILASCCLAEKVTAAEVLQEIYGSDHCPVSAEFDFSLRSSDKPLPALCSTWFTGKQSKLFDFVARSEQSGSGNEAKATRGVKRPANPSAPKAAKKKAFSQKTLFSFSTPQPTTTTTTTSGSSSSVTSTAAPSPSLSDQAQGGPGGTGTGLTGAWKEVFGGGPKPPTCSGHNEACVLRRVKKQGPNKDRQFWVCTRPQGSKGDPQAKCNFFKWVKEKKKT